MNVYTLISIKLLIILGAVYYFTSVPDQLKTFENSPICLQSQTVHKLCAVCHQKQQQFLPNKGYHIVSSNQVGVLKIPKKEEYLTCSQKLQLLNFDDHHLSGTTYQIEPIIPVLNLLNHMEAKFTKPKQQHTIQPWYNQFVIYKWKQYGKQQPLTITSVNPQYYNNAKTTLLYVFNILSIVILMAWVADSSFISSQSTPIKISLAIIAVCFQLWLLGVARWWCHYLLRLFVLNLGLFKLKVNNWNVIGYITLGLITTYFPFTICIYTGLITILVAYYGKDQSQTKSIKLYLVIFYTLLLLNYSYWYQFSIYLNDVPSIVIQFFVLMFIPTGVFLLPDQVKKGRPYNPRQEENKRMNKDRISLSMHDDEDDDQEEQ